MFAHCCWLLVVKNTSWSILKKPLKIPWHYNIVLWGKAAYLSSVKRPWTETQSTLGSRYSMENSSAGTAYTLYYRGIHSQNGNRKYKYLIWTWTHFYTVGTLPFTREYAHCNIRKDDKAEEAALREDLAAMQWDNKRVLSHQQHWGCGGL